MSEFDLEVDLEVDLAGLRLKNPIIAASGTFGYGDEYSRLDGFDPSEFGAIVLKGTTLEPRAGNPLPRMIEVTAGIINSIGLENVGAKRLAKEILPRLNLNTIIIANIAGNKVEEYGEVARILKDAPNLDAIEVNISCPNVKAGGQAFGKDKDTAARVTELVKKSAGPLPIIVKLTPEVSDIGEIAFACVNAGADCISLVNTFPAMAIDIFSLRPVLGNNYGGLSGPAIKPMALYKVCQTYQYLKTRECKVPIIGMGGIWDGEDAIEFMLAGADAVSIGTVIFAKPFAHREILDKMRHYCRFLAMQKKDPTFLKVKSLTGRVDLN